MNIPTMPEKITPIDEIQARQSGQFLEVKNTDNINSLYTFFQNYTHTKLFVITKNQRKLIIETGMKHIDMFTVWDATTGQRLHELISFADIICILLNKNQDRCKEIQHKNTSIFLDEFNLKHYLQKAKDIQKQYGQHKIEDMVCTGDEYLTRMQTIIQVAHDIVEKQMIPDLFQRIPLKKNGTFQDNRKIPVFKNNIYEAIQHDTHLHKNELVLCIIPQGTFDYDEHYDLSEPVDKHRARLAITHIEGAKKIYPLIEKDMTVNNLAVQTVYLKDDQIKPGCIYQEKSGTEYLYLGYMCIFLKNYHMDPVIKNAYMNKPFSEYTRQTHYYIRMTKAVQKMINDNPTLDGFLKEYLKKPLSKDENPNFSQRINPRKFVNQVGTPYLCNRFSITNSMASTSQIAKPIFQITTPITYTNTGCCDVCILEN